MSRPTKIILSIVLIVFASIYVPPLRFIWIAVDGAFGNRGGAFYDTIKDADRIVVRSGGYDCCGPVTRNRVLAVVTDEAEVRRISASFKFSSFQFGTSKCMCCGYPGIDWYKGDRLLALTAVQHGYALRWRGFDGDNAFTAGTGVWLNGWLAGCGAGAGTSEYNDYFSLSRLFGGK